MNFSILLYKEMLLAIRRGNSVNGKSNAKPLLLLSIFENISLMRLKQNVIMWNDEHLIDSYDGLHRYYNEIGHVPFIVPYYHLCSSEFYHLCWINENRPPIKGHTPSAKYLRENLLYAKLDDELWDLLQEAENREYLKRCIIDRYLTKQE